MNKLTGVGLTAVVLLALAACSDGTNDQQARIPAAALAPVTEVTGVIPAEANQYGVIAFGYSESTGPDGKTVYVSEPHYPVTFDATGAFSTPLPAVEQAPNPETACPFHSVTAVLGGLYSLSEPLVGDMTAPGTARTAYRLEAGDVIALYWYSPEAQRVSCTTSDDPRNMTGKRESWDLRLTAGWNMVLAHVGGDTAIMRTGSLPELEWRPMPR